MDPQHSTNGSKSAGDLCTMLAPHNTEGSDTETGSIYWVHLSSFHLKQETESSL
jgi:hypothetical protein